MSMMMHESHVSLLMSYLGRNRWTDAPIDEIDVQSAQHTGEPARCWPMLTEMLEMLAQIQANNCTVMDENRQITSMFPASKTMAPTTVNLTVPRGRSRRYLTEKEIERSDGPRPQAYPGAVHSVDHRSRLVAPITSAA